MVLWVALSLAATVPILLADYSPSLDLYQWMFEGHLVSRVLDGTGIPDYYETRSSPVPNLAASVGIGLLNLLFPSDIAARVFLGSLILAFGFAFAFLSRSLQGKPTATEFVGIPWAFGYFLYMGFLSYMVSIAIAMVGIGLLHRFSERSEPIPLARAGALAVLGALLFLSHACGWLVFTLALAVYGIRAYWRHGTNKAARIFVCLIPSLLLLVWYLESASELSETRVYEAWSSKFQSLVHPLLLFLRIDPFPSIASIFWLNVLLLLLLAAVIILNLARSSGTSARQPLRMIAIVLAGLAFLLPFSWFAGLLRPDERLILPAVLLLIASLPMRDYSTGRGLLAAGLVIAIVSVHAFEHRQASGYLASIHRVTIENVSSEGRVLWLSVHTGDLTQNACGTSSRGYSMGIPVLQHFALARMTGDEEIVTDIFGTGLIAVREESRDEPDLTMDVRTPMMLHDDADFGSRIVAEYDMVIAVGCPEHIASAEYSLSAHFSPVVAETGLLIMASDDG